MDEPLTTETYPTEVTDNVTDEDLRELRRRYRDDEHGFGDRLDCSWPPRDKHDEVYPIWFTPDDIDDQGRLVDQHGTYYQPFSGNLAPVDSVGFADACNAPLNNWRHRYHGIRFCGVAANSDSPYCRFHKNMNHVTHADADSAEEVIQTGLFTATVDHFYAKLDPLKRLVGWGIFESLMGESSYEFGVEYELKEFDFTDAEITPPTVEEDGTLAVKCGYPTENADPAVSLYVAAMMSVQMMTVQPRIMYENVAEGERMMETKTIEHAQLTAPPSEHDASPQQFETLETWSEHHLNLPLSRIITDRPKLLERGGVTTDAEESSDSVSSDDLVLEVQADMDDAETTDGGTDPNSYATDNSDYQAESEKILDKASDE